MEIRNKLLAIRGKVVEICGASKSEDYSDILGDLVSSCAISRTLGVKDEVFVQIFDGTALSVCIGYHLVGELRSTMKIALGEQELTQVSKHKLADLWGQVLATEELAIRVFREVQSGGGRSVIVLVRAMAGTVEELAGQMSREFTSVGSPKKYLNLLGLLATSQMKIGQLSRSLGSGEKGAQLFS